MDKNYFNEVSKIETNAKIGYRKWMEGQGLTPNIIGSDAYVHGVLTAKLATALMEIENLKRQIK